MGITITYHGCNNLMYNVHKKHGYALYMGAHYAQQNTLCWEILSKQIRVWKTTQTWKRRKTECIVPIACKKPI